MSLDLSDPVIAQALKQQEIAAADEQARQERQERFRQMLLVLGDNIVEMVAYSHESWPRSPRLRMPTRRSAI